MTFLSGTIDRTEGGGCLKATEALFLTILVLPHVGRCNPELLLTSQVQTVPVFVMAQALGKRT